MSHVSSKDLQEALKEKGFTLKIFSGYHEVKITGQETPVWEFDCLSEVQCFYNGIEALQMVQEK